jgi:hypothetical protein
MSITSSCDSSPSSEGISPDMTPSSSNKNCKSVSSFSSDTHYDLGQDSSRSYTRTDIQQLKIALIVTDDSAPLTFIAGRQPSVGPTHGERLYRAQRIGRLDGCGIGKVGGRCTFQPSTASCTVVKDGQAVPTLETGIIGTQESGIVLCDPHHGGILRRSSRGHYGGVGYRVDDDSHQEFSQCRLLIANSRGAQCRSNGGRSCCIDGRLRGHLSRERETRRKS